MHFQVPGGSALLVTDLTSKLNGSKNKSFHYYIWYFLNFGGRFCIGGGDGALDGTLDGVLEEPADTGGLAYPND